MRSEANVTRDIAAHEPIRFEVPGDAASFGTKVTVYRKGGTTVRGTRKTDAATAWEAKVELAARDAVLRWELETAPVPRRFELLEGPVVVRFVSIFAMKKGRALKRSKRPREWKTTKVDGDKVERLVLDALEGVVYAQDAQVVSCEWWKLYGAQGEPSRTIVEVYEAPDVLGKLSHYLEDLERSPGPRVTRARAEKGLESMRRRLPRTAPGE